MALEAAKTRQKRAVMFACPVPKQHCGGKLCEKRQNAHRAHSTPAEVKKCEENYLTKILGYKKLSPREWDQGEGLPILITSKKPARAKGGKAGRYMCDPARILPW